jgi:hypothetical protein
MVNSKSKNSNVKSISSFNAPLSFGRGVGGEVKEIQKVKSKKLASRKAW